MAATSKQEWNMDYSWTGLKFKSLKRYRICNQKRNPPRCWKFGGWNLHQIKPTAHPNMKDKGTPSENTRRPCFTMFYLANAKKNKIKKHKHPTTKKLEWCGYLQTNAKKNNIGCVKFKFFRCCFCLICATKNLHNPFELPTKHQVVWNFCHGKLTLEPFF